jgi:GAF domain-containing protein
MPQLYYDFLYLSLFIVVMLALMRVRLLAKSDDKPALSRIITGLMVLSCVSSVQLLANQQLLNFVPLFRDEAGRRLAETAGIVVGIGFLLTGIGSYLPSLAGLRARKERTNKRYFCLKMIHHAINRTTDPDDAYTQTLAALSSYLDLNRCAAFKYSSRYDTLYLACMNGAAPSAPALPKKIALNNTSLRSELIRFRAFSAAETVLPFADGPRCIIPVGSDKRLYGAVMCWGDMKFDDDMIDFMSVIGEMLGRHSAACVASAKIEFHRSHKASLEDFSNRCQQASSPKDLISDLFRIAKEMTAAEYLSIAALDNSGENMTRYTIGAGGRVLLEKGISRPTRGSEIYAIYREGLPVITADATVEEGLGIEDGLFLSCGMRSRLACPVLAGRKVTAVVTLGHAAPRHFTPLHQHRLEPLVHLMAGVIAREHLVRKLETKEDQMQQLQTIEQELGSTTDPTVFFDDACRQLTRHMNCTMARISTLDDTQTHLIARACDNMRQAAGQVKEAAPMPLSLLPWHRIALDAGKLMLINQDDIESRMQPQEAATALFADIKSAVLVPIVVSGTVRGVISIGEQRNWNRRSLGATDLVFVRAIANQCAAVLRLDETSQAATNLRPADLMTAGYDDTDIRLRSRISDPLSSIIGAAELLTRQGADDEFSTRYHAMILRSANRIKSLTENEDDSFAAAEPAVSERYLG